MDQPQTKYARAAKFNNGAKGRCFLNVPTGFKYLEAYISTTENDDDPPNQNGKVESDGRSKDDTISRDKMVYCCFR